METRYYYWTNGDHTTRDGFLPFGAGGRKKRAYAPDFNPDPAIECGQALHVVADKPLKVFEFVRRCSVGKKMPICYEVAPIDLLPEYGGKYRCRGVRKLRRLTWDEALAESKDMSIVGRLDLSNCSALTSLTIPEGVSTGGGLEWLLSKCVF